MKNLTLVACFARCTITKKTCIRGVCWFGFRVHPSHPPMHCSGSKCGGQLGTSIGGSIRAAQATFMACFPKTDWAFPLPKTARTKRKPLGGRHRCLVGISGQICAPRAHRIRCSP